MLKIDNITKSFSVGTETRRALDGVSLNVKKRRLYNNNRRKRRGEIHPVQRDRRKLHNRQRHDNP